MYQIVSNELYHHGIKGQKWGIRRFQNPDGTLTEAGKKRYGKETYNQIMRARAVDIRKPGSFYERNTRIVASKNLKKELESKKEELYSKHLTTKKAEKELLDFYSTLFDNEKEVDRIADLVVNEQVKRYGSVEKMMKEFGYEDDALVDTPSKFLDFYRQELIMEDNDRILNYWAKETPERERAYEKVAANYHNAFTDELKFVEGIADSILGAYSSQPVEKIGQHYTVTAKQAITSALLSDAPAQVLAMGPYSTTSGYDKKRNPVPLSRFV